MIEHPRNLEDGESGCGSVNTVHRRGNSIIRPTGKWSPSVHSLLQHLHDVGFRYSPRVLRVDDRSSTEELTYIKGEVAMRPWPACLLAADGIVQIGKMLREYHDAVSSYRPEPRAEWRIPGVQWQQGMIIRHGDLGPWNMVWESNLLVGLIDWDFAEPGFPVDDVAQVAWYSVPMRPSESCKDTGINSDNREHRLSCLCEAYGIDVGQVLAALTSLQQREIDRIIKFGGSGLEPWASFLSRGDVEEMTDELKWLQKYIIHAQKIEKQFE